MVADVPLRMDLAAEADRLRLDILAVRLSAALTAAVVPHALIKGPSTSLWLYDPPRSYNDVDLLVPLSEVRRAAATLADAGLTTSRAGRVGEEAPHSLLLHSSEGFEVDLHVSLPAVPPEGDEVWTALSSHIEPLGMDVGAVPALDAVGRCLVLALHALNAASSAQSTEDLIRARAACDDSTWSAVDGLAQRLGIKDLVDAGIARVEEREVPLSRRARLYLADAPDAAFGLQRLADARRRALPRLLWQELVPSRGFMVHANADVELTGRRLATAHLRRWRALARQLPAAVRARRESQ